MEYPEELGAILRGRLDDAAAARPVYVLAGEVDLSVAPALRARLVEIAGRAGREVVLDMAGVEFVDSSGVRALIEVQATLEAYGGRLVLRGVTPAARRVLEMAAVIDRFPMEDPPSG